MFRNGIFYLRNSNTPGPADIVFAYGIPGDTPLMGRWTVAGGGIQRPSSLRRPVPVGPAVAR